MAIQNRHGKWEDFDPSKMTTAEWGVVTSGDPKAIDGKSVYMAFSPGTVKRMATYEDMVENVNLAAGDAIASQIEAATGEAISACNIAAETANNAATTAVNIANTAAEDLQEMVDNGDFTGSVTIGTVTTGDAGTQASVTNSGTAKDAVLDFTIPKGDTGSVENIENSTIPFTEATTRENIASGESLKTLFGKIKKWFADLGTAAFRTVANGLAVETSGYVLDARQGKVLADRIGTLSGLKTTAKSNVVAAVNELQTNFASGNIGGFRITHHRTVLQYSNASLLRKEYSVGAEVLGVSATVIQISGTPYDQVTGIYVYIGGNNNSVITVSAKGSGFVSGHSLVVSTIIITSPK